MATFQTVRDPNDNKPWSIDWTQWLVSGDFISTSTWSAPTGLTLSSSTFGTATTTIWISGGTVGEVYNVSNKITSNDNIVDERSIDFTMVDR